MMARLAIPVWNGRVSTTFDFARKLLLVDTDRGREIHRTEVDLANRTLADRAARLRSLRVDVLICGAISRSLTQFIAAAGIRIVPLVSGDVDRVVAAYLCDRLVDPAYLLPGAELRQRKRWRYGNAARG